MHAAMELPPYTHMHLANTTTTYPDNGGTYDTVDGLDRGESDRCYSGLSVCCDGPAESLVWFEGLDGLWPETIEAFPHVLPKYYVPQSTAAVDTHSYMPPLQPMGVATSIGVSQTSWMPYCVM